jgi:tRNA (guanine26-N2/guanine27-N2)-dimethyltransferase
MFQKITEGSVTIEAPVEEKISAKLPVFYNPAMKFNRDITVLLLNSVEDKSIKVCDLLAGTGIRSIRFLAELSKGKVESIVINDLNPKSRELIEKNITANNAKFKDKKTEIEITGSEASALLLASTGFDYIDLDPFGTPNPFLDASIKRISRGGILAVTATDTSSLAGTFPKVCQRNYWAVPDKSHLKHESGLRILIRKVQLIAAQYEKALTPIFSYSKEHYMRVFFRCIKSKSKADEILANHGLFNGKGPMWLGPLHDKELVEKMYRNCSAIPDFDARFLQIIRDEGKLDIVGFHDIHVLCSRHKLEVPKYGRIFEEIKKQGHPASRTHFSEYGIKSSISEKRLIDILKCI